MPRAMKREKAMGFYASLLYLINTKPLPIEGLVMRGYSPFSQSPIGNENC
jgi:hypothetical protein